MQLDRDCGPALGRCDLHLHITGIQAQGVRVPPRQSKLEVGRDGSRGGVGGESKRELDVLRWRRGRGGKGGRVWRWRRRRRRRGGEDLVREERTLGDAEQR